MNAEVVDKGKKLKQQGIIVCGSSVAIFGPALAMMWFWESGSSFAVTN